MKLKDFMETIYLNDAEKATNTLHNVEFLHKNGWRGVWHEGLGYGVASLKENIVAIFDEDDLNVYHEFTFYKYNPKSWVDAETDVDWELIYNGANGEDADVEPI